MGIINYKNVNVYQEEHLVLQDVNFTAEKGEFVYITGKVGTGKSSLLKTMYGELKIKEGDANILGYDLPTLRRHYLPELRRKLGIVFQDFQLLTDRTVQDNLRFVLKATGWKKKIDIDNRIEEVLKQVGMETKGYKMPSELSGGEQQRIVIARAILNKPEIILADEPTGNLDVETGYAIADLLYGICKNGATVLMITHNLSLIDRNPGRVFKCENHRIKEIEAPQPESTDELD